MTEVFNVKCVDCENELEIISPAHLICQKCGSGQLEFENAVIFKCHKGHEQRGKIADEVCNECYSFEQRTLRHFERLKPAKKKEADPPDETEEEQKERELEKKKKALAKKRAEAKKKKKEAGTKIKTRSKK